MEENERSDCDKLLDCAEELIEKGAFVKAQEILDGIEENSGRKYYVQSKLFEKKDWRKEQRRQLEHAVNSDPENSEYKEALEGLIKFESKIMTDEDFYARVEESLELGDTGCAQSALDSVKEKSAKKHYYQSLIYKKRKWYNEQRKSLKAAIKADPENAVYKKELDELNEFKKTGEYKQYKKERKSNQMGQMGGVCAEGCCEAGVEGSCYCCCASVCEGIGNGC